jgi:hypothetical protein
MGAAVVLTTDRCPVTGGAPTRMSETAFRSVCGKRRDGVWVDPGLGYAPFFSASKRCGECGGERANWPEELDIIETEELNMGKKTGVCDICGERKELKHAARGGGLDVCTSCFGLLTAAGKPELLAKAVRLADAEEALANALGGSAGGNAPDQARIEGELAQMREWSEKAMSRLATMLPPVDEGLDDTRSHADIVDLANKAMSKMASDKADFYDLRNLLKPAENETLIGAAKRVVKTAAAWSALMDRARDAGFGEFAEGDPEIMASTYIMAINEVMAERDRLKAELAEARMRRICTDPASDPVNDALLEWALKRVASGKLAVRVQVSDVEEKMDAAEAAA